MGPGNHHHSLRMFGAAIAAIWLWVFEAQAQSPAPAQLALAWQAPTACPDATWAEARIAEHLGRAITTSANAQLSAGVAIEKQPAAFRLALTLQASGSTSERVIEDARCPDLAEAATLMIALAIDESEQPTEPSKAQPPPAKAEADGERVPALTPKPPPSVTKTDRGLRVQLAGMLDVGFLPKLGLGPALLLGFQRRRAGIYAGGHGFWPRSTEGSQTVRVTLWAGALDGCFGAVAQTRVELLMCAGAELGRVSAEGRGLTENLERNALFAALRGRLALKLRISGPFWVSAEPALVIPLLRQRFVTFDTTEQTTRTLHTARPLSARASLGLELHF